MNATSAQVQATTEGVSIPMVASQPAVSAPTLPLGLSSIPKPSVVTPFTIPVPSAGPRVTFPPSMTQFMNDPANLQAIQGFGQVMAMCQQNGGMQFLPGEGREAEPARTQRSRSNRQEPARTRASCQEEEAESQPRRPVANRLTGLPNDRVQQMEAKLERLEKKVGEKNNRDKPLAGSPFTTRVHLTPFPRKVKIDAPRFTGKEDPEIYLDSFNQSATMNGCTDEEKCLLFFQTLRNRATEWFNKLRPGSIDSFSDLASKFKAKFQKNCTKRKKFTYLSTAGQRESENLTQFLTRWKEEVDKKEAEHGFKPKPVQIKKEEASGPSRPRHHYDPVIRVVNTEECREIKKAPVSPPENPTGQTGRQWSGTYCSYHRSDSHNTPKCKSVKGGIRKMIDSGELGKNYLQKAQEKSHQWVRPATHGNDRDTDRRRINRQREQQLAPEKEHIGMIFGGPEGGDSDTQRKNWVHSIYVGERNARECYARAVKKMTKGVNVISQEVTKGETWEKLESEAETVEIELHPGDSSRMVRIGANLPEDLKAEITRVLQEYAGIFAWSVADMPGIDRSIICHRLAVRDGSQPVRQKKRYLASDRRDFVRKEVKDLLSVEYRPRSAIKGQALADFLVEMTGLALELPINKPTEQWWEMAVDGASGPKGYGGGIVFTTPEGFKIYHALVFNFKLTNNEAEYGALAGWLRLAQALKISQYAPEHVSKLSRVEIPDRARIEKLEVAAIAAGQSDRSNLVGADDHWMFDQMEYLMDGSLPEQDDRARKVKLRAPRFQVLNGKLYKRAFGGPLLRCLTNRKAERVIAEVHEGVCATHQMSCTLSQHIILLGYYWPTIVQVCERYV
ncbi:unnamed protein product [Cuscuta campestris]|uniref:Retrotransposon gag domain-containing protein n=1 Tax=Cuscuta campestris TaxID=132261 RepID=A0A484KN24_9ASTE|nr:unnamed protein product [Cuscuta campestris]